MTQYTHVLYHKACPDGFGAAWAAWKVLADRAKYVPVSYDAPVPDLPADARVLMVDFCYPRAICMEMANKVESLRILDHHKTSAEGMAGVPWATFDMEHSGAFLSWEHFHGREVPEFVRYLEDRDLWLFKMPYSREVAAVKLELLHPHGEKLLPERELHGIGPERGGGGHPGAAGFVEELK